MLKSWLYDKEKLFWTAGFLFIAVLTGAILSEHLILISIPFVLLIAAPVIFFTFRSAQLIFWLLLCTLPLSTEVNFTPSLGTDFPDEFLMLILTGIFLLVALVHPKLISNKVMNHLIIFVLFLHLVWILTSTVFSQKEVLSFKFLLAKSWYIIPFVFLPQLFLKDHRSFYKLSICLLVPMSLIMLQSVVRHAFYGFSFENINDTLSPFFRNHVNYGALIACLFPLLVALYSFSENRKQRRLLEWAMIFFLLALFFTYSRGAWLCIFTGLAGFYIIKKRWVNKMMITMLVVFSLAIAWVTAGSNYFKFAPDFQHTYFHKDFSEHLEATYSMKDISNAERIYRWVAGFRMIKEHPIVGFGPNTFVLYYKQYTITDFRTYVSANEEKSTVHNYFLLTLIEQGFPGLIIFVALVWAIFYSAQQTFHHKKDKFSRVAAMTTGVIFTMLVTLNMLSDLVETDKLGTLFFLCIGVLIRIDTMKSEA